MTRTTRFQVVAPSVAQADKLVVISKHVTRQAAERALRLANGAPGFRVVEV